MIESEVLQLINSVGFPIVAFLLMYHLTKTTIKENTQALQDLRETIIQMHPHVK